jgi:hypothetical protein
MYLLYILESGMRRRKVLQGLGVAGGAIAVPGIVSGKPERYDTVEVNHPLEQIGSQINIHDEQDRAAFISAALEEGIELYVAEGVEEKSEIPREVYKITANSVGGAFAPRWKEGNKLTFTRGLKQYEMSLPRSYNSQSTKIVGSNVDLNQTIKNGRKARGEDQW